MKHQWKSCPNMIKQSKNWAVLPSLLQFPNPNHDQSSSVRHSWKKLHYLNQAIQRFLFKRQKGTNTTQKPPHTFEYLIICCIHASLILQFILWHMLSNSFLLGSFNKENKSPWQISTYIFIRCPVLCLPVALAMC